MTLTILITSLLVSAISIMSAIVSIIVIRRLSKLKCICKHARKFNNDTDAQ